MQEVAAPSILSRYNMIKRLIQLGLIVGIVAGLTAAMPVGTELPDVIDYFTRVFITCFVGALAFIVVGLVLEPR